MLTQEDVVEISALARRGWSVSAISRHTGRDRKTIRRYLRGEVTEKVPAPSCVEPFREYLEARFEDDLHVLATTLFEEIVGLGFDRSYPTLVREIRRLGLRPPCPACRSGEGHPSGDIDHAPGDEIQLDWWEIQETPWGEPVYFLVGALSYSGKVRAVAVESMDFGHLVVALGELFERFGGTPRVWRTDRMATVVVPGTRRLQRQFAALACHFGVEVAVCPPRRPQRKGVVERAISFLNRSWWRSAAVTCLAEAQTDLDRFCSGRADRRRRGPGETVASLAAKEQLMALPQSVFPAEVSVERKVDAKALVNYRSNLYSVPPGYVGQTVTVRSRLGESRLDIVSADNTRIARHRLLPPGASQKARLPEHARLLDQAALEAFTTKPRCRPKDNRPPGNKALAEAARLGKTLEPEVVIDLARYAEIAGANR